MRDKSSADMRCSERVGVVIGVVEERLLDSSKYQTNAVAFVLLGSFDGERPVPVI